MQSYSNCAYMHGYCSIFVYMHNFASIDMSVFVVVKMCKINTFFFLYFASTNAVALMQYTCY